MRRAAVILVLASLACPLSSQADAGGRAGITPRDTTQLGQMLALAGGPMAREMQRYAHTPAIEDTSSESSTDIQDAGLQDAAVQDSDIDKYFFAVPSTPNASGQTEFGLADSDHADAAQPAAIPKSIWPRIRAGLAVPEIKGRRVRQFESWYRKHPEYFERMIQRSGLFLHYIVGEIEKRGMPTELALLPMIESAYNPNAYSRAHASGIWQFIPSTGKNYGLEQNWWHDERRDVIAATGAALDYLEKLHNEFGDWHLALASYNYGENGIRRAIVRNRKSGKSTKYESLRMPRETRNYLPKLQAVTNIIKDPVRVGMVLPEVPDSPYFTTVATGEHMDVELAARLAEMSIEEFETLNAAYNRPVIASAGGRQIILPVDNARIFSANLEYNDEPLLTWQTVALKKNESVDQVAARFNMDANKLRQINGIKPYVKLRTGHSLLVPMPADADESNLAETWDRPEFRRPNNFYGTRIVHRIKRGDTLSTIARRYRVSVRGIKAWNKIRGTFIRAGKKLVIYRDLRVPLVSKMLQ